MTKYKLGFSPNEQGELVATMEPPLQDRVVARRIGVGLTEMVRAGITHDNKPTVGITMQSLSEEKAVTSFSVKGIDPTRLGTRSLASFTRTLRGDVYDIMLTHLPEGDKVQ